MSFNPNPTPGGSVSVVITLSADPTSTFFYDKSAAAVNIKASAGRFYAAKVLNRSQSVVYVQIHNTASTPSASAVPVDEIPIPIGTPAILDAIHYPSLYKNCSNGIAMAVSTTSGTYTAATGGTYNSIDITILYS